MGYKAVSVQLSAFFLRVKMFIVLNGSPLVAGNSLTNTHIPNSAHMKHDMPSMCSKLSEA